MTSPRPIPRPSRPGIGARAGVTLNDRYALEAKIGEGGMGEVWRAKHLALENPVAIKFLTANVSANDETQKRFLVEAKVTAQLKSRHAVQVFDFGVTGDGHPYLVMELLHGETLDARIKRLGRLDHASTVSILRAASKALARAHSLGIIHRDFKPDNVFLTKNDEGDGEDEVKVVDFGVAKLLGGLEEDKGPPTESEIAEAVTSLDSLTRTGRFVGTPHYMSPEQIRMSAELGPAADIWALGVVAFQCVTGKCPFDGTNVLQVFAAIQLGRAQSARALVPDLPEGFEAWFARACAVDPAARFSDAVVATNALAEALLPGVPRPAPQPSMTSEAELPLNDASSPRGIAMPTLDGEIPKKRGLPLWGVAAAAALTGAVIVVGVVAAKKPRDPQPDRAAAQGSLVAALGPSAAPSSTPSSSASASALVPASASAATPSSATASASSPAVVARPGKPLPTVASTGTTAKPPDTATAPEPKPSAAPTATSKSPFALPPLGL